MNIKTKCAEIFRKFMTIISPKLNTMVCYRMKFHKRLDFDNPTTLNEKILWLKFHTYWNNPLIKQCADKYRVRDYIKAVGCEEILVPLIAVYERPDDIEWESLPDQFALKLNVGCGKNIMVSDKNKINKEEIITTLRKWMKAKQWLGYSEMQYKGVKPYILIERYLGTPEGNAPVDYKFYCLNGRAEYVMLCEDRGIESHPRFYYYDSDWNLMPFTRDALNQPDHISAKPEKIEDAFAWAQRLSEQFPFVRADFYIVDNRVYFGELTFTPSGGMDNGRLPETDRILGDMLTLPDAKD